MRSLLSLLLCTVAGSSVLLGQAPSIESQAKQARRVVVARVIGVQSRFETTAHRDRLIVSDVQLQVEETLKGVTSAVIDTTIEGGSIGPLTLKVSDMPVIRIGDRAIFFLDASSGGRHVPHKRGFGILKLDGTGRVNAQLSLADVRLAVRAALR